MPEAPAPPPRIPFNKPFVAGKELFYIAQAVTKGNLGGDGFYTRACCRLMEERFGVPHVLLTPSCTASLEMAATLCGFEPGDEVILPSYTFVSTASAFVRAGAKPVFVDVRPDTLNIDETQIEAAVTERTRAICVVHYAGIACEMDTILAIAERNGLRVVEDAAQGVNAFYKGRALGSMGDLGCYSFHETKNLICGEGGALCINDPALLRRSEILRDKGTNRQAFFRGDVDKYTWVDVGSSYVPSEITSAFLYAQLEEMDRITRRRAEIFRRYAEGLAPEVAAGRLRPPHAPAGCVGNHHLFYAILASTEARDAALEAFRAANIQAVFHYVPLHAAPMGRELAGGRSLPVTEDLAARLLRLPMFFDLTETEQDRVIATFRGFLAGGPPPDA
ncbi:dTDP-4-amino-4,6-dideoxygalactose transaminase [Phycisphaera mikurensis]|uniref:TDP-4-keto-6-deoxy-D-glucose transaminase n=1 Tax=Phycisphaera mikurensis (strain NBRC 102666 / KCTC 22515 / FYK2301M01) TaxID=1142394 RepID=I0IBF1_PHYMF|nr:dTDP-4-amino-4,6-dideoxygalactose transaminase [Phycisphaera mikurensis]MBB6442878.1 dTDP-4-amino-4,6-dideoxygalactose transaminase [Phycisphaera mikurensis]BAM02589.1 TDP-4-keto-6-deoxy-D-glucose transaminase [Phycisphaera mikurensis NBRC 102666]